MKNWILGLGLQYGARKPAWPAFALVALGAALPPAPAAAMQQQAGSIRGVVYDKDFEAPLSGARVLVVETGTSAETTDQGDFVVPELPPGRYTLVFSKDGYVRQVKTDVVVSAGQLTDVDARLAGEFTEMDEFVVEDVLASAPGTEAALLELRFESSSLMDSVGADLMSKAGASDAAGAVRLVAGATVKDGKSAVIRGLPDRYVSSQMNGMRLPSADEDKRAVELDQFPSAVIESVRITKSFTPDQQGDASGGAVDMQLEGIPSETIFEVKGQYSYNSQVRNRDDFLTYDGGGVGTWGRDDGTRDPQWDRVGESWDGAVGVREGSAPTDFKGSISAGTNHEFESGVLVGGFANFFYERDSSYFDNGQQNDLEVRDFDEGLVPEISDSLQEDFFTNLLDITQATKSVQWGGVGTLGMETAGHRLDLTYFYSHTAEDTATLAEDTRGKSFFFDEPGNPYDPDDPNHPGNQGENIAKARYKRAETLAYQERTIGTLQLGGEHAIPFDDWEWGDTLRFHDPKLSWTAAASFARLQEPDKRQFGTGYAPDVSGRLPGFQGPFLPADAVTIGFFQRTWKRIREDSEQFGVDLELPFEQWGGLEGHVKFGLFHDRVDRRFDQELFSHNELSGGDPDFFVGGFDDFWSASFPFEEHFIENTGTAIDYDGTQKIGAWYGMVDLPLHDGWKVVTGARVESTELTTDVTPQSGSSIIYINGTPILVGDDPSLADANQSERDLLPALAFLFEPFEEWTFRASYSRTVARQTFKELTPITQQEFLGGPIFIGRPDLRRSLVENWDLRADYRPFAGGLLSASVFYKYLEDPIEYVQSGGTFSFTTPVNYEWGELTGIELELRQDLGEVSDGLTGLTLGANATLIDSETKLVAGEAAGLADIGAPIETRDMTNAPEYLLNLFTTFEVPVTRAQIGIFYTVTGDSLVAGAGRNTDGNFIPSVYAKEFDTLNVSLTQPLGDIFALKLQAKNLTNPEIEEVYRSDFTEGDAIRSTYTRGIEYSVQLGAKLSF